MSLLRSDHPDDRSWMDDVPVCTPLSKFNIHHVGEISAKPPYSVVREHQDGTFFLSTLEGSGEILINGEWTKIHPNQACLMPPYRLNALRAIPGQQWTFHYVRYYQSPDQETPITCKEPVISDFDSVVFASALRGLLNEQKKGNRTKFLVQWMRLVQVHVEDFSEEWKIDDRLWDLWRAVSKDLDADWTLESLAKKACFSAEHLRRLTLSTYGRSPIKQLSWLRLQRAAELLISTSEKVEVIGLKVGYTSPFVFSAAFKRFFGASPSVYRSSRA